PHSECENHAARLLWLVLHIWGDQKFSDFLASQPTRYRHLTSRTLRWTHDEGFWHDPVDTARWNAI
ncbi:MAG: hypothetical protein LC642_06895, partial [Verrucomicrobiaceae bacterium]|nr:hypothetical protein [Verrucomicrobiaceae bacterium]